MPDGATFELSFFEKNRVEAVIQNIAKHIAELFEIVRMRIGWLKAVARL